MGEVGIRWCLGKGFFRRRHKNTHLYEILSAAISYIISFYHLLLSNLYIKVIAVGEKKEGNNMAADVRKISYKLLSGDQINSIPSKPILMSDHQYLYYYQSLRELVIRRWVLIQRDGIYQYLITRLPIIPSPIPITKNYFPPLYLLFILIRGEISLCDQGIVEWRIGNGSGNINIGKGLRFLLEEQFLVVINLFTNLAV